MGIYLSNTAVPIYYEKFRNDVLSGRIQVNQYISMEMNRIDELINDPAIYYDPRPVEGYIQFCERELTLIDGSDLKLLDSFKLWAEQLLGWYYYKQRSVYVPDEDGRGGRYIIKKIKKRLINKQFLIISRSNAKSLYLTSIQSYFLNVDTTTTNQITTAPTMRQAEEVLSPFRTAITRARGPLFRFLTEGSISNTTGKKNTRTKLASTKKGIENFITGSLLEIKPLSIHKLQGLRVKVATLDEWLSGELREDPITAIEQGAAKIDDYVILSASSEGTIRHGSGDSIKMELMDILKGEYTQRHTSIFYYRLDSIDEIADPSTWVKANPNIGTTVSYETIQLEVERAEKVPSQRNDIIAKRFGIPMEGFTYYFTYEETIKSKRKQEFWGMSCSLGIDLSQGDDFCAFTFLFPLQNGVFGVKTLNFITSLTLYKLPTALREKYEEFIEEGTLIVMDGAILELDTKVYDAVNEHINNMNYDISSVGYDPYSAKTFIEKWTLENGPYGITKVSQGYRTETVPLGELKKLAENRLLLFDEEMMSFTMGNAVAMQDVKGNRMLYKKKNEQKIDAVSALLDAFVAYKANRDSYM